MYSILQYLKKGELALFIIFLIVFVFFSFSSEYFFSLRNLMNVSGQLAITLIAAIGFAVLLIAGEVDISIGSLLAFVALPLIQIMNLTESVALGIIACLIFGAVIGLINGYLSVYLRISSLIVTLGMLFILRGIVYLYTGQRPISDDLYSDFFFNIGNGKLLGVVPYAAIIAFLILAVFLFVMRNTSYGRKLYAIGGNAEVARLAGYNIKLIKLSAFVICSVLSSISAILLASRIGSANHIAGDLFEFQVVAAVVLGGVSLAGGIGTLAGAALGVMILAIVSNGLGMLNVESQWQMVVNGIIIIIAVGFDELKRKKS
jgi:ribose/xylose/arabinose/galactoside ABC-type transport system permease subunit|tara:strand:+ start:2870 stop:3820 length:951 start_codon:yes stop_codon:yes gene_type:complete